MCQFKTCEPIDCQHCFKTVTLEGFDSVSAEYEEMRRRGWVVIPHTGTSIFCSDECRRAGWRPNPRYYGEESIRWFEESKKNQE